MHPGSPPPGARRAGAHKSFDSPILRAYPTRLPEQRARIRFGDDVHRVTCLDQRGLDDAAEFARSVSPADLLLVIGVVDRVGVGEFYGLGIVRRDLNLTTNVLFHAGSWKLADFGIARNTGVLATTTFQRAGTVGYMAPEQDAGTEAQPSPTSTRSEGSSHIC